MQTVSPPPVTMTTPPPDAKIENPTADGPKRPPKAATCLRAGECLECGADQTTQPTKRTYLYEEARKAYQQARDLEPKNPQPILKLARLYEKVGNQQFAVATYEQGLKELPEHAGMRHELGMYYARQKHWPQAIEALRKAVELEPQNPTYSNNLGWTLARAGHFDESLAHFARTVGPARAHYNLARMAGHLNQPELCSQHLVAALQVDPNFADARTMLEQIQKNETLSQQVVPAEAPATPQ